MLRRALSLIRKNKASEKAQESETRHVNQTVSLAHENREKIASEYREAMCVQISDVQQRCQAIGKVEEMQNNRDQILKDLTAKTINELAERYKTSDSDICRMLSENPIDSSASDPFAKFRTNDGLLGTLSHSSTLGSSDSAEANTPAKTVQSQDNDPLQTPTSKLTELEQSGYLESWVKDHPDGWNHDDWLSLLDQIAKRGFSEVPYAEVGRKIEELKHKIAWAESQRQIQRLRNTRQKARRASEKLLERYQREGVEIQLWSIEIEIKQLSHSISLVHDLGEADSRKHAERGLIIACPNCGEYNDEARDAILLIHCLKVKAAIPSGTNTESLVAGKCPGCGGGHFLAFYSHEHAQLNL